MRNKPPTMKWERFTIEQIGDTGLKYRIVDGVKQAVVAQCCDALNAAILVVMLNEASEKLK